MISALKAEVIPCGELKDGTGVIIRVCVPLRIRHGGWLLETIPFYTLLRNIIHRVMALTERYGGWTDRREVEELLVLAVKIRTVRENLHMEHMKRYSTRSNEKNFSGLKGEIEYEGDMTLFVP